MADFDRPAFEWIVISKNMSDPALYNTEFEVPAITSSTFIATWNNADNAFDFITRNKSVISYPTG